MSGDGEHDPMGGSLGWTARDCARLGSVVGWVGRQIAMIGECVLLRILPALISARDG